MPREQKRLVLGMDQTNNLQELKDLLSLVNYSETGSATLQNGHFNFSRATAFTMVQGYISNMYTLDQPTTVALLCLYLPVFILSLAGNSLVIYVVYKNPHMRRLKNLFLVNLAIADLAVTLICMPLTAGQIVFRLWVYGEAMCKLIGYIQGVAVNCSIFTLAALSIDRYMAIKNSVVGSCNSCMSPGLLFLATWLPAAICMSPLLCVRQVHAMAFPEFSIEISYCIEEWPKQMSRKVYGIALLFVTYILPLVIIIGCYSLIGRKLCSVEFHRKTSDSSSTVMLGRTRVARMLIALIAVFVLSWLPYNVTSLSLDLNYKYLDVRVLPYTLLLAHAHSAVNPFLYWFLNKSFRHCMRRALRCSTRKAMRREVPSPNVNGGGVSPWARLLGLDFTKRDSSSKSNKKLTVPKVTHNDEKHPRGRFRASSHPSPSLATESSKKNVRFEIDASSSALLKSPKIPIEIFGTFPTDSPPKSESMVVLHRSPSLSPHVSVNSV